MAVPTWFTSSLLLLTLCIFITGNATPFDCRRIGQECFSDADVCNSSSPVCYCADNAYSGPACEIVDSLTDGAGCDAKNCSANSTCQSNGVANCSCDPGFYGDLCDIEYISVECKTGEMRVFFNPMGTFSGIIYVEGRRNESTCHAVALPSPLAPDMEKSYEGYYIDLLHNSSVCGEILPYENGSTTMVDRTFIINYFPALLLGFDQTIVARCAFDNENNNIQVASVAVSDDTSVLGRDEVEDEYSPAAVEVTYQADGSVVDTASVIPLHTLLDVTVTLDEAHGGITIHGIKFNASTDGQDDYEWDVMEDGCVGAGAKSILFDGPSYPGAPDKTVIKFSFATFHVYAHPKVTLWITTKVCLDPADCSLPVCAARKKRQASTTEEREYEVTLIIDQPETDKDVAAEKTSNDFQNQPYFIPIILGIVGFSILLAILAVLVCILVRRRPQRLNKA